MLYDNTKINKIRIKNEYNKKEKRNCLWKKKKF